MKKATPKQGDYIPRSAAQSESPAAKSDSGSSPEMPASRGDKLFSLLGRLDGNQLVSVTQSAVSLANNIVELGKTQQETARVEAQVRQEMTRIEAERQVALKKQDVELRRLKNERQQHQQQHQAQMDDSQKRHDRIMQLLQMVEKGDISAQDLVAIIQASGDDQCFR